MEIIYICFQHVLKREIKSTFQFFDFLFQLIQLRTRGLEPLFSLFRVRGFEPPFSYSPSMRFCC